MTESTRTDTCRRCGLPPGPAEEANGTQAWDPEEGCASCRHLTEDDLTLLDEYASMTVYLRYEYTGTFQDYDDCEEHQRLVRRWTALGLLEPSHAGPRAKPGAVAHLALRPRAN